MGASAGSELTCKVCYMAGSQEERGAGAQAEALGSSGSDRPGFRALQRLHVALDLTSRQPTASMPDLAVPFVAEDVAVPETAHRCACGKPSCLCSPVALLDPFLLHVYCLAVPHACWCEYPSPWYVRHRAERPLHTCC